MRQRILYVGGLLVLVFTGPLIYQIWHVPEMPHLSPSERAGIADETQLLTLQQSFDTWESLQAKLSSEESPSQAAYRTWRTMRYTWIGVFGAFTSLGLGMLAYGLSLPGKEPAARSKAIGK